MPTRRFEARPRLQQRSDASERENHRRKRSDLSGAYKSISKTACPRGKPCLPSVVSSAGFLTTGLETTTGFCKCSVPLRVCLLQTEQMEPDDRSRVSDGSRQAVIVRVSSQQWYKWNARWIAGNNQSKVTYSVERSSLVKQSLSSPQSWLPIQLTLSHLTPLNQASQYLDVPKLARRT